MHAEFPCYNTLMDFDAILQAISIFLWGDPDLAANTAILGSILGAVGGSLFSGLLGNLFGGGSKKDKNAELRVRTAEAQAEAEAEEAQRLARERQTSAARRLRELQAPATGLLAFFNSGRRGA